MEASPVENSAASPSTRSSCLLFLDDDVLRLIFGYLDDWYIRRIRATCKRLNELTLPLRYSELNILSCSYLTSIWNWKYAGHWQEGRLVYLRNLRIRDWHRGDCRCLPAIANILTEAKNLCRLSIAHSDDFFRAGYCDITMAVCTFPNLSELCLDHVGFATASLLGRIQSDLRAVSLEFQVGCHPSRLCMFALRNLSRFRHLSVLTIDSVTLEPTVPSLPSIRKLTVTKAYGNTALLGTLFPGLESLMGVQEVEFDPNLESPPARWTKLAEIAGSAYALYRLLPLIAYTVRRVLMQNEWEDVVPSIETYEHIIVEIVRRTSPCTLVMYAAWPGTPSLFPRLAQEAPSLEYLHLRLGYFTHWPVRNLIPSLQTKSQKLCCRIWPR